MIKNTKKSTQIKNNKKQEKSASPPPNRRRLLVIILFLLFAIMAGTWLWQQNYATTFDPNEQLTKGMENTFHSESYAFKSHSTLYLDNTANNAQQTREERVFAVIEGEKNGSNRHISGSVLGTDIEMYLVDGTLHRRDSIDGTWHSVPMANIAQGAMLTNEMDPQYNFHFSEIGGVEYVGRENINGQKLDKFVFKPILEDKWIVKYFGDITFTIWLTTGRNPYMVQSIISAVSKENTAATLVIENYFSNFNQVDPIQAPVMQ